MKLETIRLEGNYIQTNGSTHLSDYLKTNPPLKMLYLQNNKLDDTDAKMIAGGLKHNTNLKYIHLGGNNITDVGSKELSSVIFDSTSSFNATADSNHTCTIEGLGPSILCSNFRMQLMNELDSKVNRGRKLYTLLSKTNTVVGDLNSEFGDDMLKLSPHVLGCVHRYSLDWGTDMPEYKTAQIVSAPIIIHPITILYELLRGWNMPVLYDGYRERQRHAELANKYPEIFRSFEGMPNSLRMIRSWANM